MKRCSNCGAELPEDSVFCQYCGSKDIIEEKAFERNDLISLGNNSEQLNEEKRKNKTLLIICICLVALSCFFGYELNQNYQQLNEVNEKLTSTKSQLKTAQNQATKDKTKASYYDDIKNNASNSSNTNFYVSNTVLKKPNKTRVVFYIGYSGSYTINWEYSSGIEITSGNTSKGLVYIDVTYNGKGVGTIECTNSVNSQKITIYCIGND